MPLPTPSEGVQRLIRAARKQTPNVLTHSLVAVKAAAAISDALEIPIARGVLGGVALLIESVEVRPRFRVSCHCTDERIER